MARWTRAQVEDLAPDDRSVAAAKKLARPGPWSETGSTDTLVWGKCQGSGRTPYQVSVDLTGPAVKCTCPSRKFPCKHGLALLLLWVDGGGAVADVAAPADFAGDWAAGRTAKASAPTKQPDKPVDPEAQAKRLERRLALMSGGIDDFERWLGDLYRAGFASARTRPYNYWDRTAARLTDSQLPGLAQRVRDLPTLLHGADWADRLLVETGRWFTAVRAWQHRDRLDDDDMANLRSYLGWAIPSDEVRAGEATTDTWVVDGLHRTDDGRVKSQRTWLRGLETQERALLLDFAGGSAFLDVGHVVGSGVTAPLAWYPGSGVRRAVLLDGSRATGSTGRLPATGTIDQALSDVALQLGANPFLDLHPVTIRARVEVTEERTRVLDAEGAMLSVVPDFEPWELMALAGPESVAMFGELEDSGFRPLSVQLDDALVTV